SPDPGGTPRDRTTEGLPPLSPTGAAFHEAFIAAIEDDLDLPTAIGLVHALLRSDLSADERRWLLLDADAVLGLDLHRAWETKAPRRVLTTRVATLQAQ